MSIQIIECREFRRLKPTNTYYGVWMQRQLVGFLGVQSVLDEATVTNVVIAKDYQGKGLSNVYGKWPYTI